MNGTSQKELLFQDAQVIWNYFFLIILFVVVLFNNSFVLTASWSQKRLHSQPNVIVLASVALAQLLGGLVAIPINMVLVQDTEVQDYKDDMRLKFSKVFTTFSGVATQLHLCLLCVDRCVIVLDSLVHSNIKRVNVFTATVIVWVLSILAATLSLVDFKNYSIFLAIVFFILPCLFDVLGYAIMYRSSAGQHQTTLLKKELRLAKWFAIFTVISNVLWLPFLITTLLRDYCGSCGSEKSSLYLFVLYCKLMSLAISAAIYYRASLDFRLAFKMLASELWDVIRNNHSSDDTTRDSNQNHDDITISENRDGNPRHSELYSCQSDTSPAKAELEEVHVVPFDQTKYFSANETEESAQADLTEFNGGISLKGELSIHNIDVVPYDQAC